MRITERPKHLGANKPNRSHEVVVMLFGIILLKYIASWSGGKDSTAGIILAHLHNEPLDTIVFAEVMYDKKRGISGENPEHIHFIKNVAKPVFESWGYEVLILHSDIDYLDSFHYVIRNPIKYPERRGMKRGFPFSGTCVIKRDCKIKPIKEYYRTLKDEYIEYTGIAVDEKPRLISLKKDKTKVSLLEKYGYTENDAFRLCEEYGLLSPTYELSHRGGCWFCPNAKLCEHADIRNKNRELWDEFCSLENTYNIVNTNWNVFGDTLKEREEILRNIIDF